MLIWQTEVMYEWRKHGGKKKYTSYKPITERSLDVLYAGGISRGFAYNMIPDFSKMGFDAKAVAVTDSSIYMKEEFTGTVDEGKPDNRQLVMFELEEIDKLPDTVKELLGNKT